MSGTTSLRLSEKEQNYLDDLKKAYKITNSSELIRVLIRNEHNHLIQLEGLNNLSDKQIVNLGLYPNCTTKYKRKEV